MKLSLPRMADAVEPDLEIRPVYVEEWLEQRPYANPPLLAEQLYEQLRRHNRNPMRAGTRQTILELYLRGYHYLANLQRTTRRSFEPGAVRRREQMTRRLRRLSTEMAFGYKLLVSDHVRRRNASRRELRLCLQRATFFLGQCITHCFDLYRPLPKGLWSELGLVYEYAAQHKLAGEPVKAPVESEEYAASVERIYKQLLLASLVDPYHLGAGDFWLIFDVMGDCTDATELSEMRATDRSAGLFVVDPRRDSRPEHYGQFNGTPPEQALLLNANPALDHFRGLQRARASGARLPGHVLAAALRALGLPPKRHTPRQSSSGRVIVSVGLSTVHYFLGGAVPPPAGGASGESGESETEIALSDVSGGMMASTYAYSTDEWSVIDEGPGGIGLTRQPGAEFTVGVGELLGLQFPARGDSEFDWTIGIARWLSISSEGDHQLGVQLLNESAQPISLINESVSETLTRIARPALAVPRLSADRGASILATHGLYGVNSELRVEFDGGTVSVTIVENIEQTGSIDRLAYKMRLES